MRNILAGLVLVFASLLRKVVDGGSMRKLLTGFVFIFASLPCFAQFIGYTSPQTVQVKLATAVTCTGSPQTFITGTTPGFSNIGQTQHVVTSSSANAQQFTMELDGIDVVGNIFRISDVQVGSSPGIGTAAVPAVLSGSGYFSQLQVVVTCLPVTATFSAAYQGFSSAPNPVSGSSFISSIDKILFAGAPANASQNLSFQTPNGNAGGTVYFNFVTTSETGSSLSFSCLSAKGNIINTVGFPLANNTSAQVFQVPSGVCPLVAFGYSSGGATTATFAAEYVFAAPGLQQSWDPCANGGIKLSAPINISTATTTLLVSGAAGPSNSVISVCGFTVTETGTTPTFQFEYGSGATCGTGTVLLSGVLTPVVSDPFVEPVGGTFVKTVSAGIAGAVQSLCVVTGGTLPSLQGTITYVQQ